MMTHDISEAYDPCDEAIAAAVEKAREEERERIVAIILDAAFAAYQWHSHLGSHLRSLADTISTPPTENSSG